MIKEFSVEEADKIVTIFEMEESASTEVADYFRDLSLNYSDYCSGRLQWPERPKGLKPVYRVKPLGE
jgi:hypothetical protein